ncbi:hypothetical protein BCR39DRAFT_593552 [Naematelia encephala]|uniref:Uncharacterized protein n=1 Tax=Naematelia encephala TaxID=71784 RepID=A0A1Y2B859_9TREE|nr:hypothetical protein BCR39DRAFT_593552 [Naematelia encephala]
MIVRYPPALSFSVYLEVQNSIKRRDAVPQSGTKRPEYIAHPAGSLVCRPFGECEPCPHNELDQPFCLPFGNRRLLHCLPADQAHDVLSGYESADDRKQPKGEVPAWEACGKVIVTERRDFYEFVTANLLFLIVALTILWARSSALAAAQYRQLAARIGIPSGSWRS